MMRLRPSTPKTARSPLDSKLCISARLRAAKISEVIKNTTLGSMLLTTRNLSNLPSFTAAQVDVNVLLRFRIDKGSTNAITDGNLRPSRAE